MMSKMVSLCFDPLHPPPTCVPNTYRRRRRHRLHLSSPLPAPQLRSYPYRRACRRPDRSDAGVRSCNENRREFNVGVAHCQDFATSAAPAMHPDICKIRIPRNVDRPAEKRFNLGFVIREQHVVTWDPARSEKIIDHFPDRHDLRIISDRAYRNTLSFGHTRRLYSCWDSGAKHSPPRRGGEYKKRISFISNIDPIDALDPESYIRELS